MSRRTQVLTLSLPHFEYETFTLFGLPSQVILLCFRSISCESYNPDLWSVWAVPISLAATPGIDLSFFSSCYLDVSIHKVLLYAVMYSLHDVQFLSWTGFPIRISPVL